MSRTDSIRLEFLQSSLPFSLSLSLCRCDHALKSSVRTLRAHLSLKFTHLCGSNQNSAAGFWDGYCDGLWDCRILDLTLNLPHKTRWKRVRTFVRDVFYIKCIITSYIFKYIFIYFSTKFVYSVLRVKYNVCSLYIEICKVFGFKTFNTKKRFDSSLFLK